MTPIGFSTRGMLSRTVFAVLGLSLVLVLAGLGAALFLIGSDLGQNFLRARTEAAVARVLGPGFETDLGEQTFILRPDATLSIAWNGVSIRRSDEPATSTEVDRLALVLRLLPLAGGRVEFGRLEMEGARVDLATFERFMAPGVPQAAEEEAGEQPLIARLSEATTQFLERQIGALRSLDFQTLAFRNIAIRGIPRLTGGFEDAHIDFTELHRTPDGALTLAASFDIGPLPVSVSGRAEFEPGGRLSRFAVRSGTLELDRLVPPAPLADVTDERPFGTDADLALTLAMTRAAEGNGFVSDLTASVGPGAVQAGRNRTRIEAAQIYLRHPAGSQALELRESDIRFEGVTMQAEGSVKPADDGTGFRFDLRAPLRSTVGHEDGESSATLLLAGLWDTKAQRASLEQIELSTEQGALTGTGSSDYATPAGRTRVDLAARSLSANDVKAFWPFNLGGGARRWVLSHVGNEGFVPQGTITLDLRRDRLSRAFRPGPGPRRSEIDMNVAIENADFDTLGELPRLYQVNGRLEMQGARTTIFADDAMVAEKPSIVLAPSSVSFSRPGRDALRETRIDLDVDAVGDIRQLLEVADAAPLRALRAGPFAPEAATGTGRARARAELRVGETVAPQDVLREWSAEAELIDATLLEPLQGRRFEHLSGPLAISPGLVEGKLAGLMDDMPATIVLSVPVGASAPGERIVEIDLDVGADKVLDIAPGLAGAVDGPVTAHVTQGPAGTSMRLDLTRARLSVPAVAWSKGQGIPARLALDVETGDGQTTLRNMRLEGQGFSVAGSAVLGEGGLRNARLSNVMLNPGDAVSVAIDRTDNGFAVAVDGEAFDARPLLQALQSNALQPPVPSGEQGALDVSANIARVRGFNDRGLSDITLQYTGKGGQISALSLAARLGTGTARADIAPRSHEQAVRLETSDLGALLAFGGLYANMEGGGGRLDVLGTLATGYRGNVALNDFTLVDEPRLERLVGSEPVAGQGTLSQAVGRDLRTNRAYFDQASAGLSYRDGRLTVASGILRGPIFGSSFEGVLYDPQGRIAITGSFMPAYTVNRLFGAIPLVGSILGNGNEGGLIGITYQLAGNVASPTLTVNPISLIAPGIFRQIFEY